MKNFIFLISLIFSLNGFSQWGAKIDFVSYTIKAEMGAGGASLSSSEDYAGFSFGLDYGFEIKKLMFVAGLSADFIDFEGDSETIITPSVLLRYPVSNAIDLKGGFALPTWDVDDDDVIKASLLHLPLGFEFSFSEKISLIGQYSIALGNRFNGDESGGDEFFSSSEFKYTDNNLRFGIHFSF